MMGRPFLNIKAGELSPQDLYDRPQNQLSGYAVARDDRQQTETLRHVEGPNRGGIVERLWHEIGSIFTKRY